MAMKSINSLQKSGYQGVKVTSMLSAVLSKEIKQHLRLIQIDELSIIKNKYERNKYISKEEMVLLWNIYWNFVLNDYRFNDKSKKYTIVVKTKEVEPKHIGLKMYKQLTK